MTMLTALLMSITISMTIIMATKMYHIVLIAEHLYEEKERGLLRALLRDRHDWILRHFMCGFTGLVMLWLVKSIQGLEIPDALPAALALYSGISLAFAFLDSLLTNKIATLLATMPVPIRVRNQE